MSKDLPVHDRLGHEHWSVSKALPVHDRLARLVLSGHVVAGRQTVCRWHLVTHLLTSCGSRTDSRTWLLAPEPDLSQT